MREYCLIFLKEYYLGIAKRKKVCYNKLYNKNQGKTV